MNAAGRATLIAPDLLITGTVSAPDVVLRAEFGSITEAGAGGVIADALTSFSAAAPS